MDLAGVEDGHEVEDVAGHDLSRDEDREARWVRRDEHRRHHLSSLRDPNGQLLGGKVLTSAGDVGQEVRVPQVAVRTLGVMPEPVGEPAEVR